MVNLTRRYNNQATEPAQDGQEPFRFGAASSRTRESQLLPSNPTFTFSAPTTLSNAPPPDSATSRPGSRTPSRGSLFSTTPVTFFGSAALSTAPPFPAARDRAGSDAPVFAFGGMSDSGTSVYTPSSTPFTFSSTPGVTPRPSPSPSPQPHSSLPGHSPLPSSPRRAASSGPVASRSSPDGFAGSTSQDALPTQSLSPLSGRDSVRDGTRSPRGRSPSLGLDVSGLSLEHDPEELTPYDIDSEQMPPHQFFSTEFQSTLREGVSIAERTVAVIDRLTGVVGTDDALFRLREDAQRLSSFRPAEMKTIAVLGDSGEGKSSLINSLLGFPGLANTADTGSACTSVVTEYHQKEERHSAPINIEVECIPQPEIEGVLSELLWNYRQLYLPAVESEDTPREDYRRISRESARAWSALEAAFSHRREFRELQFRDVSEGTLERNRVRLVEWSRELEWPEGVVDGRWASTAESAEECRLKTQLFMRDQYWPFTKAIRIYLDAQVLRTGVVFADLPGLQDTNLERARATEDYLMRCDNIFIVANITRSITNLSLQSSLFTVFSRHDPQEWEDSPARSLNIAVVCTKSDNIDLEPVRRELCGGKWISFPQMEELDQKIEDARHARNKVLQKELERRRKLTLINARNEHVKESLKATYESEMRGHGLEVFCVSNKLYNKYAPIGNAEVVRASAIPAVRKFCHMVSADVQLHEAKHYLRFSLFSLVNSLRIWSSSAARAREEATASDETRRVLGRALDTADARFAEAVSRFRNNFDECFQRQIHALLLSLIPEIGREADAEARKWRDWHPSQYITWCVNDGSHSTNKREVRDWNADIIRKMEMELTSGWDAVEEKIPALFSTLSNSVKEELADLKQSVLDLCHDGSRGLVIDAVASGRRQFSYQSNLSEQRFTQEFRLVRRYASESSPNSYILDEMLPAYRAAKSERGNGMVARQQAIIEGRIKDGAPFSNILNTITEKIGSIAEVAQRELREATRGVIAQIRGDSDLVLIVSRPPEPEVRSPESVRRLMELAGVVERLKEDVGRVGGILERNDN